MRSSLLLHPQCRCEAVSGIGTHVMRTSPAGLDARFLVKGNVRGLRLPLPGSPSRADGLWRHTCFEFFVRAPGKQSYYEFNFAPSLQWAAYGFDGYRRGMRELQELPPPRIEIRQDATSLELVAELKLDRLADVAGESRWRIGLSAVIEEAAGGISYWALAHPTGKPDFHHADAFALTLPANGGPGHGNDFREA